MLGAILGDIIGSPYEFHNYRMEDFELFGRFSRFTDDTVLTVATAHAILTQTDYGKNYHGFGNRFPGHGYGVMFSDWLGNSNPVPYGSYGNGAPMRVSPVGLFFQTIEEVRQEAKHTALPTHNHPEGIKGAVSIAEAIYHLRKGMVNEDLLRFFESEHGYRIDRNLAHAREANRFSESSQTTVPLAVTALIHASSFEDCVRKAVSLGGDSDTIAAIAGSLAEARFGIPVSLEQKAIALLPQEFKAIVEEFYSKLKG
jgi:ADP-ribosyl-[dinitrogen reductase] hydrolase